MPQNLVNHYIVLCKRRCLDFKNIAPHTLQETYIHVPELIHPLGAMKHYMYVQLSGIIIIAIRELPKEDFEGFERVGAKLCL